MTRTRLVLLAVLLAGGAAHAQPVDPADLLRALREAVARVDYTTAEARAREALARYDALSPDQLVEVHTTLGVLLAGRSEDVEARRQFEAALSINPSHALDPVLVPPKTVELFESVRRSLAQTAPTTAAPPALRYIVLPDRRPGAALRSAVLPGWGQFYKGDRGRGLAFAVGTGALAAGTAAAHAATTRARTRYDAAATSDEADRLYGPYDRLYRVRGALLRGAVLVWAASVVEALTTGAPEPPDRSLQLAPAEVGTGLGLRVRF